jgi:integrase
MTTLNDESLLTLEEACEVFLRGKATPATLLAESRRGKLALYRIGRRDYTTLADLKEMQRLCLVQNPVQGSGLIKSVKRTASSMAAASSAQAAAKATFPGAKKFLEAYLAAHHTVAGGADPMIADVLKVYGEEHLATKVSAYSVSYDLENLTDWWGAKAVSEITAENCRAYIKHRDRPTCCRRELGFLKAAVNYWHKHRAKLSSMPVIVKPDRTPPRTRWLTRSEAARFLWATRQLNPRQRKRIRRFFIVGWYTGTRHAAITGLRWDMIDIEARIMTRRPPGVAETKKRRPPVRMGRRLLSHLRRWKRIDGGAYTYLIEHGGQPAQDMGRAWDAVCELAKLPDDVTPHTLRHSRATHMMRQGIDPWEAAQSLGMSLEMLQTNYGHHHPNWQTGAAEAR